MKLFGAAILVLGLAACGGEYTDVEILPVDPVTEAAEHGACADPQGVCDYYLGEYDPHVEDAAEGCSHEVEGNVGWNEYMQKVNGCQSGGTDYSGDHFVRKVVNVNCASFSHSDEAVTLQMPAAGHCWWYHWDQSGGGYFNDYFQSDTASCTGSIICGSWADP